MIVAAVLVVLALLLGFLTFLLQADPLRRVRPISILVCFLWGSTGAVALAMVINTHFQMEMVTASSNVVELQESFGFTAVVVAPICEELVKALPLLFILLAFPHLLERDTNGLLMGAAVGLGFTVFEDAHYLIQAEQTGGFDNLLTLLTLRTVVGGYTHLVFSAFVGWGVARAHTRNLLYLPLGLGFGMFLHAMHNALVGINFSFFLLEKAFLVILLFFLVAALKKDMSRARDVLNRALWLHQPQVGWSQEEMDFLERPRRWWSLARKKPEHRQFIGAYSKLVQQAFLERVNPGEALLYRLVSGRAQLRRALGLPSESQDLSS